MAVIPATKKRGRPREEPGEPAKVLRPKEKVRAEPWALPDEAILIAAARVIKHRDACRERYQRTRQAIRRTLPLLLRKKRTIYQTSTLDDYSRDSLAAMGGTGSITRDSILRSTESERD